MMKSYHLFFKRVFPALILVFAVSGAVFAKDELKIKKVELGYPVPAIPYYHLSADIELPTPSIIEVEVAVDGKVLRYTNLHHSTDYINLMRPAVMHRPPSGAGLSQDNTIYQNLNVTGWVKWQPGQTYDIKINVRMKKSVRPSPADKIITASAKVTAPPEQRFLTLPGRSINRSFSRKRLVLTERMSLLTYSLLFIPMRSGI